MRLFDSLYRLEKTEKEEAESNRVSRQNYQRFCAIFYLMTRKLVRDAVFIMRREKKVRVQPRHLLTAAIVNGFVPESMISENQLTPSQRDEVKNIIATRKSEIEARRPSEAKNIGAKIN